MTDYELARPNEAKLLKYLEEVNTNWRNVAISLLGYLSDYDVGDWMRENEYFLDSDEEEKSISVIIYDIKWDDEDYDVKPDLPKTIAHNFDGYDDINDEDLIEEISDWLSDEYGYCHFGFKVKEDH